MLVALTIIQKNGKIETNAATIRNKYVNVDFVLAITLTCHFKLDEGKNDNHNYDRVRYRRRITKVWRILERQIVNVLRDRCRCITRSALRNVYNFIEQLQCTDR